MTDNDTITLKDAASHFGFSVYTLRAEAERGHLTTYKIGKKLYTTPADVREMVTKCRVSQNALGSIWTNGDPLGSFGTGQGSSARAALRAVLSKPECSLAVTSLANTSRNPARRP
jgi:hypothetical protein